MKLKLYLDITNLMQVDFLTGIQRVVREIVVRFLTDERLDVTLLVYTEALNGFELLDNKKFYGYYTGSMDEKGEIYTGKACTICDMEAGGIFYDMDSAWHSKQKRSTLLPQLRNQGLKLAVYLYDIIPIIHPQFAHQNTIILFMEYLGAYLKHADIIIASTQATLNYINALIRQMGIKEIPGFVSWLGVDFSKEDDGEIQIHKDAEKAVKSGKYVLMVGTVEPRKNHKLVLDAFDDKLFGLGYNLVFAGHFGWDVDELKERILNHPLLSDQFFYVENGNNATIDYLYRNAYMIAFPSYAEGFGLPVIEALGRGKPVIASDYNVIYEVGEGFAEFFNPHDKEAFISVFEKYHNNPVDYEDWIHKIESYQPFSWEQAESRIVDALTFLKPSEEKAIKGTVKQMVMLTARADDLLNTVPFIEAYMPFIKEMIVCCPDGIIEEVSENYHGNIKFIFLPDSKVLEGRPLPEEHQPRNFFLRCMLMKQKILDDVFIMSDDDYRPLYPITEDVFYKDNKYRGFYFYELHSWRGCQGALTSFDVGVHKTLNFCENNKYPTLQFNAHIPQIIEKKIFVEMTQVHAGVEMGGFDEWTMYFSYLMAHYPHKVIFDEYKTMNWPGSVTDWTMYCQPDDFIFENYYGYIYSSKGLFAGINPAYNENTLEMNKRKNELVLGVREQYNRNKEYFIGYCRRYAKKCGEYPVFCITNIYGKAKMFMPAYMEFVKGSCNRIDITIYGIGQWKKHPKKIQFAYYYVDRFGRELHNDKIVEAETSDRLIEIPFVAPVEQGNYVLCCEITTDGVTFASRAKLKVEEYKNAGEKYGR